MDSDRQLSKGIARVEVGALRRTEARRRADAEEYTPPESVVRDAMEVFGYTREEAIAEVSGIDRAFGLTGKEEQ